MARLGMEQISAKSVVDSCFFAGDDNKDRGQVMVEGHDLYGSMYQKAQEQRLEWDVFSEPRQLPREIRIVIKNHVENQVPRR